MSKPEKPPPNRRATLPFDREVSPWVRTGQWSAIGLEFGAAVVLFFLGGRALDATLGTTPWLAVAGAMIGVAAGIYLMVRPLLRNRSGESSPASSSDSGTEKGGE